MAAQNGLKLSQESTTVGVLGGGAWGTALAFHCARRGHNTLLWARETDVVEGINGPDRENSMFLKVSRSLQLFCPCLLFAACMALQAAQVERKRCCSAASTITVVLFSFTSHHIIFCLLYQIVVVHLAASMGHGYDRVTKHQKA